MADSTAKKYNMPPIDQGQGMADGSGRVRLSRPMLEYLQGIDDVSGRVASNVATLDGDTNAANMSAKIDEIITALETAKLAEDS